MPRRILTSSGIPILFGCLALFGCSGTSSTTVTKGDCGAVEPCGGDVVGIWTIQQSCESETSAPDFCAQATMDTSGLVFSGTLTYDADLTYSASVKQSGTLSVTLPSPCLTINGVTLTCQQLASKFTANLSSAIVGTVTCSAVGTGCGCAFTAQPQTAEKSGTYKLSGTSIVTSPPIGTAAGDPYCINGGRLHLLTVSAPTTVADAGGAVITSDIVASQSP